MAKSKDHIKVPLNSLLTIGIPAFLLICGGIFALAKHISQQNIDTLQISLEHQNQVNNKLENKLKELTVNNSSQKAQKLPQVTLDATEDAQSTQELADRISELEKERGQLTQQLSQKAINSLDPESELPVLLKQLSSKKAEVRQGAITGLFVLKDPRSFSPLVAHFTQNSEEATNQNTTSIWAWYDLLFELNQQSTIELLVNTMDTQNEYKSYVAYKTLNEHITSIELIDTCKPYLESLALRSTNSSARARAKVLLSKLSEKREELVEKEKKATERATEKKQREGERTQKEILLDIEEFIHNLSLSKLNQIDSVTEPNANIAGTP